MPIASVLNYSPLGQVVWPFGGVGVVADCLNARGSHKVELSGDGSCVRKTPLRVSLRAAVEWIFSDNYHKDVHLQLLAEPDGFIPLGRVVESYGTVGELVTTACAGQTDAARAFLLLEALGSSAELVVQPAAGPLASALGRVRRKTLAEKIISQVEWYLDPSRLAADRYLYEQQADHDGLIPLATLLSFPRMRKLCHPQVGAVAHVLGQSARLEVSAGSQAAGALVRPARAVPPSPVRSDRGEAEAALAAAAIFGREFVGAGGAPPAAADRLSGFTAMTYVSRSRFAYDLGEVYL